MGHLNEEDLVLHFYGELDSAGVTRTEAHLAGCGDCRASYTRLQRVMAAVDTMPDPVLPEGFERVTWARLQPSLRRSTGWRTWFVLSPASLALASAVLVLVTGAFFAGRLSRAPEPAAVVSADQFRERVLLTDLGEHLDRSQMMLVDLVSAGEGDAVDMSSERRRAEDLVVANRLYRQTAEESGEARGLGAPRRARASARGPRGKSRHNCHRRTWKKFERGLTPMDCYSRYASCPRRCENGRSRQVRAASSARASLGLRTDTDLTRMSTTD